MLLAVVFIVTDTALFVPPREISLSLTHVGGKSGDTLRVALYHSSWIDVTKISHESTKNDCTKTFHRIAIVLCDILDQRVINVVLSDSSIDHWKVNEVDVKLAGRPIKYSIKPRRKRYG